MAKLTSEQIDKIAYLARIALTSEEKTQLMPQLSSILDFVAKLQEVDTKGVTETSQVTGLVDVWREDEVVRCEISREQLLKNTPNVKDGYIVVKRVL